MTDDVTDDAADDAMDRAAARARFYATIVVGVGILLDLFAIINGAPDIDLTAIMTAVIAGGLVCSLPVNCAVMTASAARRDAPRKPVNPNSLLMQAIIPLLGAAPAGVMAMAIGYQLPGIVAGVASVVVAAALWPTEKRVALIVSGEAKVQFPVS